MLSTYERIYSIVRQVPYGKVVTYGQVGQLAGGVSARQVGYAMAALRNVSKPDVPWQRVINRQGRISIRDPFGGAIQRQILEQEGVKFDSKDRVDFALYGWVGVPE